MRRLVVLAVLASACGGGSKGAAPKGGEAGNDDLHIPKVDPKLCDTKNKKVVTFDLNKDGKPDVWKLYEEKDTKGGGADVLTCKQVDLNHDGKKDYVAEYDDNGNLIAEEYDFDFDGHFDARVHIDKKTGKKYAVERMSGFNEKPDVWEIYGPDEKLESVRRDRNGDGKPDYWEQYLAGNLDKILYDDNYDGTVDRKEEAHPAREIGAAPAAEGAVAAPPPEEPAPATQPAPAKAPEKKPPAKKR
jgi:hypothetical protein